MDSDRQAILALMRAYCDTLDGGDLAGCAALFENGAWGIDGALAQGSDAVLAQLRNVTLYDGKPLTRHLMSNVQIIIVQGEDCATAESCLTVMQCVPPSFPLQSIFVGTYADRFSKRDGHWTFSERRIFPDLIGDMSHHRSDMA